ncbi:MULTISPECIES: hypothetical protein [unclassified Acidovorax]|jgi:hypothetical protein|uniref:hypothetical protein n=1 Tax=unclassified Acidovorax TaxID=2684926 RepID=UPI001177C589|nr:MULTISPECIES: hypothetical protein [unclassified Acidovorax]MBP3979759.1 hypothetical protein [Acidovorax sp. JG5]
MNRFWLAAGRACADEKEGQSALPKRRFYGAARADAGKKRPAACADAQRRGCEGLLDPFTPCTFTNSSQS